MTKCDGCKICKLETTLGDSWKKYLSAEFEKKYFSEIKSFLHNSVTFFPPIDQIFQFSKLTKFEDIKVVILGQDPYHNDNQAMGLSFSVREGITQPPSLKNIFKELKDDIEGFETPKSGDLTKWAQQGVLLLNDCLTVEKKQPGSHSKIGWENFTKEIIQLINEKLENVVFILWGNYARKKSILLNPKKHLILEAAHPSPFSAEKFYGCKHFSKTNEYLIKHNKTPIQWSLK